MQLRFEASVCAAIPVIKVLREALVVSNVHRVLGIVNGTTNFVLTEMERGATYDEALAEAQRLGFAEADPTEDVSGKDAAAKMAILATVAFGSRVTARGRLVRRARARRARGRRRRARDGHGRAAVGAATLVDERWDVRVGPALVDRSHPLAAVEGAFNAVMLQGDAIREITLEGPGAGGLETASAVVADMVTIVGTTGTGFLQNDACWRELDRLPEGEVVVARSTSASRSPTGPACSRSSRCGSRRTASRSRGSSSSRATGARRSTSSRTRRRPGGSRDALAEIDGLEETRGRRPRCR